MIKRVVMWFVLVPFGVLMAIFALANRHTIQIGVDPISPQTPFWGPIELPLFVVIYICLIMGVLLGGVGGWFSQGKHRKEERRLRRDLNKVHKDAEAEKPPVSEDPLALLEADRS